MPPLYKRSICVMCSVKDACDGVRWATVCGACAESLKCLAGPGVGHADCKKLRATWLDLPRKCLLVSQLVNKKANENDDCFVQQESEDALVCPRCSQGQGRVYVDHALNHMFRRETKYIYTCDYCGVDETLAVT
jgi:hypothetical protein